MQQKQHKNVGCCRYKGDGVPAAKPKVSIFTSSLDHGVGVCAAIGNKGGGWQPVFRPLPRVDTPHTLILKVHLLLNH